MMQVADTNGDGRMNYEEFLKLMTEHTVRGLRKALCRLPFPLGGGREGGFRTMM